MSNVVEVEIKISELLNDLRSGLDWTGETNSIQAKYEMETEDIEAIRLHPVLQKPIRVFRIVDDVTPKPVQQEEILQGPGPEFTEETAAKHAIEEFEAATKTDEDNSLDFMNL